MKLKVNQMSMGGIRVKNKNIPIIGKELDVSFTKFDKYIKVGAIKLVEKDLKSKSDFIEALQKVIKNLDNGTYTVHHDEGLFARFDVKNKQLIRLHKWSENTGILMPCWNYFKE